MAQVTSGTVKSNTLWYSTFYVSWNRTSYDVNKNESYISWEAGLIITNGAYWLSNAVRINSIYINGSLVLGSNTYSNISGNGTHKLASGTTTIKHNDDGNKSFDISISGWLYDTGSPSGSGTFELVQIPRYASCSQSLKSKTETSIDITWSSNETINAVKWSTDGGATWSAGEIGFSLKNSYYTIYNLSPNTTYTIKTQVKRKDNNLWTESSALSVTTYDYPSVSKVETSSLIIGNSQTLTLYNPLSRNVTIKMYKDSTSGTQLYSGSTSGTSITFTPTASTLYSSIPSSQSGNCVYSATYSSNTKTTTGSYTYKVIGTETPTIGTITYADTNSTVTAITGNNQHIVQNHSNLKVTFTSATAKNSATISKHSFTLNGVTKESTSSSGSVDFGVINSANDLTLTIKVTDSRGLTSSTTKTITMLEHSNPNATVTLNRLNNYEDETYLTVDASISSVNSKNTMTIKYRYKVSGESYGSFTTISDNVKQTLSLDKNNAYIINVVVTDAFGSTYDKEHSLGKGVFPLFIDTDKNAVGINTFPTENEALRVAGGNINIENTGTDVGYQQGGNMILRHNLGVTVVSGRGGDVMLRPKGSTDSSVQFKITQKGTISVNDVSVIAYGSYSFGNYVKFYDGTMIQWNYEEVTDQAINNAYGSLYQGTRTITYPVAFVGNTPVLTCSMFKWGSSASWGTTTENDTPLTKGTLRGIDAFSRATGTTCRIAWTAIGRWK